MKRIYILLVSVVLLLFGCSRDETGIVNSYHTTVDGQEIEIIFSEGTKSDGNIVAQNGTYHFSYDLDGSFTVVYPNGYAYSHQDINGAIASSWSYPESPGELGYLGGLSLEWAIQDASRSSSGNQRAVPIAVSLLLVGTGICHLCAPKSVWWLARGWWYKNAEPSDIALGIYRIGGGLLVFVGILSFLA